MHPQSSRLLCLLALVVTIAGCSGARDEHIRGLHCAEDEECPSGQRCRAEMCVDEDAGVEEMPDASVPLDASEVLDAHDAELDTAPPMSQPDASVPVRAAGRTQGANATVEVLVAGGDCQPGVCTTAAGATVTFRAPQVAGYRFVNWTGDAGCQGETPELVLSNVAANIECVANYAWRLSVRGVVMGGSGEVSAASSAVAAACSAARCEVDQGQAVTLKAPVQPGFRFQGWSGAGCPENGGETIEVKPTEGDVVCTAKFTPGFVIRGRATGSAAVIDVTSDAPFARCMDSACQVDAGSRVTLVAPELPGFRFVGFGGDAPCISSERTVVIASADADAECVATYLARYQIRGSATGLTPAPAIVATSLDTYATCAGNVCTVDHGGSARLFAPTVSGYRLRDWTGFGCAPDAGPAPTLSKITQALDCVAEYVLGVGVSGAAAGGANPTITAASSSPGAQCSGASCGIDMGGTVTLTTTEVPGFTFGGWSGDAGCASTQLSVTLSTVLDSRTCTANYTRLRYRVNGVAAPADGGSIEFQAGSATGVCDANGCTVDHGSSVKLTARPRASHEFVAWEGCAGNSAQAAIDVTNVQAVTTCTARFRIRSLPVMVTTLPSGGGIIPTPCNGAVSCSVNVTYNTDLALVAQATPSYVFMEWTGCVASPTPSVTVRSVTSATTCTANFGHSVRALIAPAGEGTLPNCAAAPCVVAHNASQRLGAPVVRNPAQYELAGWTGCVGSPQTDGSLQLTQVAANLECTASLRLRSFRVDAAVNPAGAGTLSMPCASTTTCNVNVTYGQPAPLTVAAAAGYVFAGWSGCTAETPTAPSTRIASVTAAQTCTANFNHRVTTRVDPATAASAPQCANGCAVNHGAGFTLNPPTLSDPNYEFRGWDCGNNLSSASPTFAIAQVNTNLDCVAKYERPRYRFDVLVSPARAATLIAPCAASSCSGGVLKGDTPTLTVGAAATGFVFAGWSGCNVDTPTALSTKLKPATGDTTCTANFVHEVSASVEPAALGPATSCPATAPCRVLDNAAVTLTIPAVTDVRFVFVGWDCAGTVDPVTHALTIPAVTTSLKCTARYEQPQYRLSTVTAPPNVSTFITPCTLSSCATPVGRGGTPQVAVTAEPANYSFRRWTGCNVVNANVPSTTLAAMLTDQTCTAEFEHRIRATVSPPEAGTITRCTSAAPCYVKDGASFTVGPPPPDSATHAFAGWTGTGCTGQTQNDRSLLINPVSTHVDCVANYRVRPTGPDLVVDQVAAGTVAVVLSPAGARQLQVGLRVTVVNQGNAAANAPAGAVARVALRGGANKTVSGFISMPASIAAGAKVTLDGSALVPLANELSVNITAEADTCAATVPPPQGCLIQETNELNNESQPITVAVPTRTVSDAGVSLPGTTVPGTITPGTIVPGTIVPGVLVPATNVPSAVRPDVVGQGPLVSQLRDAGAP